MLCTRESPELFAAVCAEVFVRDEFLLFLVIKRMHQGRSSGERRGACLERLEAPAQCVSPTGPRLRFGLEEAGEALSQSEKPWIILLKKRSATALSQQWPLRLMQHGMPRASSSCRESSLAY